jgi:hypothetical protein
MRVQVTLQQWLCSNIAEAEAAVSVNEKKLLVMHMHDAAAVAVVAANHPPC